MKRWNLVVGKSAKVLSVLLSVSMVCSMTAACGKKSEGAEPSAVIERLTGAAEDGEAESGETEGTESKDSGAEANDAGTDETGESADTASTDATVALLENAMYGEDSMKHHSAESGKSETVYVLSDADGAPHEVIVSDWLRNKDGAAQLKDESGLKDIKNVSGYETFEQSGDSLTMTLDITPMRQTVATAEAEGAQLSSDNSVPLSQTQAVAVTAATRVTAGVPSEMALAAGGARSTVYVRHTHNGKTYEYPAVISGNAADGYTATFDNPNGYSEFTLGVQSGAVASYVYNGVTYRYTSFAEAISDALRKYVTTLTLYKMPSGEDYATVTKPVTFTFSVADGCEDLVDLDKLYTDWLLEDDGIVKASSAEQLAEHKIRFALTS